MDVIEKIKYFSNNIPMNTAIKIGKDKINYKQLFEEICQYRRIIEEHEYVMEKEKVIIIYMNRSIEFIIAMLAIISSGYYYIPLEKPVPLERLKYIINDSKCKLIITDNREEINVNGVKIIDCSNRYKSREFEIIKEKKRLVYAMYTSGTTGKPKGVKITYENLMNLIKSFEKIIYHNYDEHINVAVIAPFSFDASVKQIYCSLYYGNSLIIANNIDKCIGRKLVDFWNKNNINITDITPSYIEIILQSRKKIKSIVFLIGGESLHWNKVEQLRKLTDGTCSIINLYGPTECCVDVAYNIIADETNKKYGTVSIGIPLENTYLKIKDENGVDICKRGKKGELCIIGKQVGAGYINKNKGGYYKERGNNAYKTGDIAFYDENWEIHIIGRKDNQIKINGNRVELEEVKYVFQKVTKIEEVIVCFDNISRKIICFINNKEKQLSYKEVVKEMSIYINKYMIPNKIVRVEYFPLNENGKPDIKKMLSMIKEKKTNE